MHFERYAKNALSTSTGYPEGQHPLAHNALCLAGEVGEMAEKIKKRLRDGHGCFNPGDVHALMLECGDILWYLNRQAEELRHRMSLFAPAEIPWPEDDCRSALYREHTGLKLIACLNLSKLASRQERGVIHGSGDNR